MRNIADSTGEIERAIDKLWSASDAERLEGKRAIVRLGAPAAEPLVTLLEDLMVDKRLRFPRGKESEGRSALDRAWRTHREREERKKTREHPLDVAKEVAEALSVFEEVTALAINRRLLFDAIELLGDIGAESAVPALIEILETERPGFSFSSAPHMRPEMIALAKIRAPAVEPLLDLVQDANRRVSDPVTFYPTSLDLSPAPDPSQLEEPDWGETLAEEEDTDPQQAVAEGPLGMLSMRMVARAAMVLAAIGDARALPVLKKLLSEKDCGTAEHYIVDAIKSIESSSLNHAI